MLRKSIGQLVWYSILAALSFSVVRIIYLQSQEPKIVKAAIPIQAFSAIQEIYTAPDNTTAQLASRRTFARRQDGSETWVDVVRSGKDGDFQVLRRIEFANGQAQTLIDSIKGRLSGYVDRDRLERRLASITSPPEGCLEPFEKKVGVEKLFGIEFQVTEGSDGNARKRTWKALSLGCFNAQLQQDKKIGETWQTVLDVKLVSLTPGEPNSQLFSEGDKYREMTPTQSYIEAARARGLEPEKCTKCMESVWELEKAYWAKQAPPPR